MKNSKTYPFNVDTYYYYRGEITTAAYMVSRGVKPVYSFVCQAHYFKHLTEELDRCLNCYGLYYMDYFYDVYGEPYVELKLFKYPYLERVIRFSSKLRGPLPDFSVIDVRDFIAFREWMNGKMFGYGDIEIGEHIEKLFTKMYGEER